MRITGLIWPSPLGTMTKRQSNQTHAASHGYNLARPHVLRVPVPKAFDLGNAVSSYGFFMLAPNKWVKVCRIIVFMRPIPFLTYTQIYLS